MSQRPVFVASAELRPKLPAAALGLLIAINVALWPLITYDMREFLVPWVQHIAAHGPIAAFGHPFSNYTPTYLYLLALASPLLAIISSVSLVKLVSAVGTLWAGWSICRLLKASGSEPSQLVAIGALLIPTLLLNGGFFGQCDALWAAPCLLAVASAVEKKPRAMLLWWGVALAFKAQAIFLAPFVAGFLIAKRGEWHSWLIPPAVYAAFMLPAWALGWPAADLALVYVRQAGTFADLSMNAPNIWVIVQDVPSLGALPLTPLAFAAAAAAGALLILALRGKADPDRLILLALLSALLLPGLLPRMHERYFLLADLLAFTYAVRRGDRRAWLIFGAVELGSSLGLLAAVLSVVAFAQLGAVTMILGTLTCVSLAFRERRMRVANRQTDLIDIAPRPVEVGALLPPVPSIP